MSSASTTAAPRVSPNVRLTGRSSSVFRLSVPHSAGKIFFDATSATAINDNIKGEEAIRTRRVDSDAEDELSESQAGLHASSEHSSSGGGVLNGDASSGDISSVYFLDFETSGSEYLVWFKCPFYPSKGVGSRTEKVVKAVRLAVGCLCNHVSVRRNFSCFWDRQELECYFCQGRGREGPRVSFQHKLRMRVQYQRVSGRYERPI